MGALLEVEGLSLAAVGGKGPVAIVEELSFAVATGGAVALVGESGSGKSLSALALPGLLPPGVAVTAGAARWFGPGGDAAAVDLLLLSTKEMRRLRGREIGMIFQEPETSLNPVLTVGEQVAEVLRYGAGRSRSSARVEAVELLERVGLPRAGASFRTWPHELSGGMRQRVMIAMATALRPALLIADEPTTSLDVTLEAQILDELRRRRIEEGLALLLVSHDLALVEGLTDEVVVLYAGRVVESGPVGAIFGQARHPYTSGLLHCRPALGSGRAFAAIPGSVPPPGHRLSGCRFRDRCPFADPRCEETPPLKPVGRGNHRVACHLVEAGELGPDPWPVAASSGTEPS